MLNLVHFSQLFTTCFFGCFVKYHSYTFIYFKLLLTWNLPNSQFKHGDSFSPSVLPQLTQWGPRRHHALELRLDHRRRSLELGGSVVDEELHHDFVQPREGLLSLCNVLAVF